MHTTLKDSPDFIESSSLLRKLVTRAVEDCRGDSILFSGGLDTSIIAAVASKSNPRLRAFTVIFENCPGSDLSYSKIASAKFGLTHEIISATLEEIEASLVEVIKILQSFDSMEVRNSVVTFIGLKAAKQGGFKIVLTGDGADELFAGYNFVAKLPKPEAIAKLHHLWAVMHFSSKPLASSLGIQALLLFLDGQVKKFAAEKIPFDFLIGSDADGRTYGKYILRKAFEEMLPTEITWREKTPIEFGSGTTALARLYSTKITNTEFDDKRKRHLESDRVRIRDKEQLHYYEIYRKEFGPPTSNPERRICPACTSNVEESQNFCITCGEYPI